MRVDGAVDEHHRNPVESHDSVTPTSNSKMLLPVTLIVCGVVTFTICALAHLPSNSSALLMLLGMISTASGIAIGLFRCRTPAALLLWGMLLILLDAFGPTVISDIRVLSPLGVILTACGLATILFRKARARAVKGSQLSPNAALWAYITKLPPFKVAGVCFALIPVTVLAAAVVISSLPYPANDRLDDTAVWTVVVLLPSIGIGIGFLALGTFRWAKSKLLQQFSRPP